MGVISLDVQPGRLRTHYDAAMRRLRDVRAVERLWNADVSAFSPIPKEVLDRLGWLDHPVTMATVADESIQLVSEADDEGIDRWYVIGMGGASLASEMMDLLEFGAGRPRTITVVDGTSPDEWRSILDSLDPRRSMLVLSMKAWSYEAFAIWMTLLTRFEETLGREQATRHAIILTDPGTWLVPYAQRLGVRRVLLNDPFVGGRYAAASWVGLLPAAVRGANTHTLLERARDVRDRCRPASEEKAPFATMLAAVMVASVTAGEPYLHVEPSPCWNGFAEWIEQLVAESLGKDGTGVVPVTVPLPAADSPRSGEALPAVWPGVRWLVAPERGAGSIAHHDHRPTITLAAEDHYDVLGACFLAEAAVALAAAALGVHPFDQPDVESTKVHLVRALHPRSVVRVGEAADALPMDRRARAVSVEDPPTEVPEGIPSRIWIERAWSRVPIGHYLALCLYIPRQPAVRRAVQAWWSALRQASPAPVTLGYGPRYLHSTGQGHKGGGPPPHVCIVTCNADAEMVVPTDPPLSAQHLTLALADADARAVVAAGREVTRLHIPSSDVEASFMKATRTFIDGTRS